MGLDRRQWFEVLGVPPDASDEEVKKAHSTLRRRFHPDKNLDDPQAEENFKRVEVARREYEERGAADAEAFRREKKMAWKRKEAAANQEDAASFGDALRGTPKSPPSAGRAAPPKTPKGPVPPGPGGSVPPEAPTPAEPIFVAPRPAPRTVGAFGVIVLWAFLITAVSLGMSLAGAYLARHSTGYPGEIHEFIPMVGYLLELSAVAGVAALVAVAVTELISVNGGDPPARYSPAIILQQPTYALTLVAVAVVLIALDKLTYAGDFRSLGPGSGWFWILGPASLCVAHVLSLTIDRWRIRASAAVLMIPMAASCGAIACGLLFA
jgi:DnaJ domain